MALGYTSGDIAEQLVVSVETVKTHRNNIIWKFNARNACHCVAIGIRLGLI